MFVQILKISFNIYIYITIHRSFSIHSQACEAGLTDTQRVQLDSERRRTISHPPVSKQMDYKTFPEVDDKPNAKQRRSESSVITTNSNTSELCCDDEDKVSKSPLRDFLVVLALTFHAVLEGTAVGLEKDLNDIWILFAGIRTLFCSKTFFPMLWLINVLFETFHASLKIKHFIR